MELASLCLPAEVRGENLQPLRVRGKWRLELFHQPSTEGGRRGSDPLCPLEESKEAVEGGRPREGEAAHTCPPDPGRGGRLTGRLSYSSSVCQSPSLWITEHSLTHSLTYTHTHTHTHTQVIKRAEFRRRNGASVWCTLWSS